MIKSKLVKACRKFVHSYIKLKYFRNGKNLISRVINISEKEYSIFFGYHDKTPFSNDCSIMLAHRGRFQANDKHAIENYIEVGFYRLDGNPTFVKIGDTRCWCWQQGSMLQFLPGTDFNHVIFNTEVQKNLGCKVVNISSLKIEEQYTFPVYSLSPDGKLASSIDFFGLGIRRPGYGYFNYLNETDGFPYVRVFSLQSKKLIYERIIKSKRSYVNHLSFSPDSKKLIYFLIDESNSKRNISIELINLEDLSETYTPVEGPQFSHFCWLDNDRILVSVGKKLFWGAYILDFRKQKARLTRIKNLFTGDFHPMRNPKNRDVIADSYIVKGKQKLIYANFERKSNLVLLDIAVNSNLSGEVRCDLHPRFDPTGTKVAIDVAPNEHREMRILELK